MERKDSDWRQEKKQLTQKGKHLLNSSLWWDCWFVVGERHVQKEFKAHRLFLAMASPVFEAMFYGPMAEKYDLILVEDVSAEGFHLLLEYIYTDAISIQTFRDARDVCYAAKKLLMQDLVRICVGKLQEFLSPETACFAFEFANYIGEAELARDALSVISSKTTEVLQDLGFGEVQLSTLEAILDMEKLAISSEVQLFDALLQWAKRECARKGAEQSAWALRAAVKSALPKVRFLTLQPQQLAQGPAASALLTRDESYALFMHISSSPPWSVPLPPGFSASRVPRNNASLQELISGAGSTFIQNVRIVESNYTEDKATFAISFHCSAQMSISGVEVRKPAWTTTDVTVSVWESNTIRSGCSIRLAEITNRYNNPYYTNYPHAFASSASTKHLNFVSFANRVELHRTKRYEIMVAMVSGTATSMLVNNHARLQSSTNLNNKLFSIGGDYLIKSVLL